MLQGAYLLVGNLMQIRISVCCQVSGRFQCLVRFLILCSLHYNCDPLCDLLPLCNLKSVKNNHGGVLFLVKLQSFKSNTPTWVFFTFFKLYQITQNITVTQSICLLKNSYSQAVLSPQRSEILPPL